MPTLLSIPSYFKIDKPRIGEMAFAGWGRGWWKHQQRQKDKQNAAQKEVDGTLLEWQKRVGGLTCMQRSSKGRRQLAHPAAAWDGSGERGGSRERVKVYSLKVWTPRPPNAPWRTAESRTFTSGNITKTTANSCNCNSKQLFPKEIKRTTWHK